MSSVLIVAKCNVNNTGVLKSTIILFVLIVAKCNVNSNTPYVIITASFVLIVAKCNVNFQKTEKLLSELSY